MSKAKHTPGPWKVDSTQPHAHIGTDDTSVCWMHRPTQGKFSGELEANARLIAAAPEMLEALQKLKMQVEDQGLSDRFAMSLSLVDRAIAKARGVA